MRDATLAATAVRERGLLNQAGMEASRRRARPFARARSAQGFSLIELLMVVALLAVMAGIAIGITPGVVRSAKGNAGSSQVGSVLRRAREMAIARRRNVRVTFAGTDRIVIEQINVPGPGTTPIETQRFEGRIEYTRFAVVDTPDGFGNGAAVQIGGPLPVMFTSEGQFVDANGDPTNATIQLGVPNQLETASAITILGPTANIRVYRFNGSNGWVE
jgi:prepilin-type N-terminal cleavage/methylation domain-containing protein